MRWTANIAKATMALFCCAAVVTLVYLFYASALRERVENKLYDVRTRLAPDLIPTDPVTVVGISEATIIRLDPGKQDLSYDSLLRIVRAALQSKARYVAVILPPQVFSYKAPQLAELRRLAADDPRLVFGVIGSANHDQTKAEIPAALRGLKTQVFNAELKRTFKRDIVRDLTLAERGHLTYLDGGLFKKLDPEGYASLPRSPDGNLAIRLNYVRPAHLDVLPAEDLLDPKAEAYLNNKIVLVGYTAYRPWSFDFSEGTYVNTPWQAEGDDAREGIPMVMLHAIGLLDLVDHAWLTQAHASLIVLQAVVLAVVAYATWQLTIGFACLLFIGGWSLLLILHALGFAFMQLDVPLADGFLWSSMATLAGAFLRLRSEGILRARQAARFQADKELAETQDRFLNRFAVELAGINEQIGQILASMATDLPEGGTARTAFMRAVGSNEELSDYLGGIRQFASLRRQQLARPTLAPIDLATVVDTILRQFETRKLEAKVTFDVKLPEGCTVLSDRTLVGQIVYNLVSNAVKYSPPGSAVVIDAVTSKRSVAVRVRDRGPGIAPEFHDRIFEKFYRVKDDYVYKHKGHGLGLYLSRFFAEQIGARLDVASEVGQGAEFTLTLPAAAERAAP